VSAKVTTPAKQKVKDHQNKKTENKNVANNKNNTHMYMNTLPKLKKQL